MTHLKIVINSIEDAKNGKPIDERITSIDQIKEVKLETAAILEGGTDGGNIAINFIGEDPENKGKFILMQLTRNLMDGLYHAMLGAEQRFQDDIKKN